MDTFTLQTLKNRLRELNLELKANPNLILKSEHKSLQQFFKVRFRI